MIGGIVRLDGEYSDTGPPALLAMLLAASQPYERPPFTPQNYSLALFQFCSWCFLLLTNMLILRISATVLLQVRGTPPNHHDVCGFSGSAGTSRTLPGS